MIVTHSAKTISVRDWPFPGEFLQPFGNDSDYLNFSLHFSIEAVTVCNMNLAKKSVAQDISNESDEYAVLQSICRNSTNLNGPIRNAEAGKWPIYRKVLLNVTQRCDEMLIKCQFGLVDVDCMKVFNSILTDSGVCCIFNGLHSKFMMKSVYKLRKYLFHIEIVKWSSNLILMNNFTK